MTHPTEEQLVLYFFGESANPQSIAVHLDACQACRADYALIQQTLNIASAMDVPERGPGYGEQTWQRLAPHIRRRPWFSPHWLQPRRLAAAAAMAGLLVCAYLAGRWPLRPSVDQTAARRNPAFQQRVLLVNLGDHLERSQTMLVELANVDAAEFRQEQDRAGDLLAANRLYRLSARGKLQPGTQDLLDELDQLLTEVANAGPEEMERIRRRIAQQDLLFKLRVFNAQLRDQQQQPLPVSSN